jgi:hypothetical protein
MPTCCSELKSIVKSCRDRETRKSPPVPRVGFAVPHVAQTQGFFCFFFLRLAGTICSEKEWNDWGMITAKVNLFCCYRE